MRGMRGKARLCPIPATFGGQTGLRNHAPGPALGEGSRIGVSKLESHVMSHVYAISEIVGTSETSIEDAIQQAVSVAGQSLRNLDWFEVSNLRGHIQDGRVAHYQVAVKIGFRYEAKSS